MKAIITAAALLTLAASPIAAQNTQKLSATKSNDYGLTYTLPTTVLDVTIAAERTDLTPGPFYNYARKYLDIDPIMQPATEWELAAVTVNPRGEVRTDDPDSRFLVKFKKGSTPFITLSPEGIPLAINIDAQDTSGSLINPLPEAKEAETSILDRPEARQAMTQEMLQAQSTAKRAELAAQRIFELRQMRSDIMSGQADNMPSDGTAMKLALDNINRQEAALTAMFAGTRQHSTVVTTIPFTPDSGEGDAASGSTVIARISPVDGIVSSDDLSGSPVTITVSDIQGADVPVNERGEELRFPKGGVAYRIPGSALVTVTADNGQKLFSQRFDIAQLGIIYGLDPDIFTDRKAPAAVTFVPATGAVSSLSQQAQ